MERRTTSRSTSLQKQLAENAKRSRAPAESVPDLTDFMNDMFFGTPVVEKKVYNLTGDNERDESEDDRDSFDSSRRSVSSRTTEEWLEEAKRMVAQSPARNESPSRRVSGSPRFSTVHHQSVGSAIDARNPLSRSARRHRPVEGLGGEILSKSAQHNRSRQQTTVTPPAPPEEESSASAVQKWLSNILKPQNQNPQNPNPTAVQQPPDSSSPPLLPRQTTSRRSRFQNASPSHPIPPPAPTKRTFKTPANFNPTATNANDPLLSPPKHLVESAHRRSISASTCSVPESSALSPSSPPPTHRKSVSIASYDSPTRDLFESSSRRSIASGTHNQDRLLTRDNFLVHYQAEESKNLKLNGFLKQQRTKMEKIMSGESDGKAKIVLSGATNSTSSMVAAICYAWLLEIRTRADMEERDQQGINAELVVPVLNIKRGKMWKQKQAAWLFHHVGIDASALIFSDEMDLETLMMTRKMSILIVGEDILRTKGEVGSSCTILTDNYCEDAYDLLQIPMLKKLLLAGILLDTQNLNSSTKLCTARDSEAIQLLLVGSSPTYRTSLFDKLMLDQRDGAFSQVLEKNYGKPPSESNSSKGPSPQQPISDKVPDPGRVVHNSDKSPVEVKKAIANTVSPKPAKPLSTSTKPPATAAADPPRGKNGFFLAKWFGFGSK